MSKLVQVQYQNEFGQNLCILIFDQERYYIGVEIAQLLQRETYNLYRSLKVKNITLRRASPEQVDHLLKTNIVKPGTRSITLIPIEKSRSFIKDELKKLSRKRYKSNDDEMEVVKEISPLDLLCEAAEAEYNQEQLTKQQEQQSQHLHSHQIQHIPILEPQPTILDWQWNKLLLNNYYSTYGPAAKLHPQLCL
eukprot:TRINITY_DN6615_c0_g1_i1.p1 TRINITY_DN6615_c0_g1~~TRINITY_DN6615_c0_g1_i1.p1  ORF type:complete len:205 (-),score=24.43 TRINITY_DN6615_c0_g1_i1:50-628(-)